MGKVIKMVTNYQIEKANNIRQLKILVEQYIIIDKNKVLQKIKLEQ